jgi:hypothetical protein
MGCFISLSTKRMRRMGSGCEYEYTTAKAVRLQPLGAQCREPSPGSQHTKSPGHTFQLLFDGFAREWPPLTRKCGGSVIFTSYSPPPRRTLERLWYRNPFCLPYRVRYVLVLQVGSLKLEVDQFGSTVTRRPGTFYKIEPADYSTE